MIEFIEACLREKESVWVEKEGRQVEDPLKSRISWEQLYLHPIFKGQFDQIVREVAGSTILLTMKTNALSNGVDVIQVLEEFKLKSKTIHKEEMSILFEKHNVSIQGEDIDRLARMFGKQGAMEVDLLL